MSQKFNIEVSDIIAQKLNDYQNHVQPLSIEDVISSFITNEIEYITSLNDTPPKVPPRVKSAPNIRNMYWCDFPKDAQLPEFWKRRPVIVVSYKRSLFGAVTIIPCSTQPQDDNEWAYRLKTTIDGREAWAICDKMTTVAVSRLLPDKNHIKRLPEAEFNEIFKIALKWLPTVE